MRRHAWYHASLLDPGTRSPVWTGVFREAQTSQWLPGDAWDEKAGAYAQKPVPMTVQGLFTLPVDFASGERVLALAILDPAGNLPAARFATANYWKGGRHPMGRIGMGAAPARVELDPAGFDDPAADRSLRYAIGG